MSSPFRPPGSLYDPRGFAVGVLATESIEETHGLRQQQWRWFYGSEHRDTPFPAHRALSGRFMTSMGSLDGYYPGDHRGCLCSVEPVYVRVDTGRVVGREEVRALGEGPAPAPAQVDAQRFFQAADNDAAQGWISRLANDLGQGDVTPDGPSDVSWASAMRQYTQTGRNAGYARVNSALRAGKELKGATKKIVDGMDEAVQSTRLNENVTLFRGIDDGATDLIEAFDSGDLVGKTLQDRAYQSTSLDLESASGLLDREGGMMLEIRAPRGTNAAIGSRDEAELILGRETGLRVVETGLREVEWLGERVLRRYVVAEVV